MTERERETLFRRERETKRERDFVQTRESKPNFSDYSFQHRAKESSAKNALNCIEEPHFT